MKYISFFLVLFFLITNTLEIVAQKISDIPELLLKNANHVLIEDKTSITVISEKKAVTEYYMLVAVMKEGSRYRSHSAYYDDFVSIADLKVTIYSQVGEKIETYKKKDFSDYPSSGSELYTNNRTLIIDLDKHKLPYIVEIEQKTEHNDDLVISNYISQVYNESVMNSSYEVTYPSDLPIQYKLYNDAVEPTKTVNDETETLRWNYKNLQAMEYETMAPSVVKYFPFISIRPSKFHYDGYDGSMETWDAYNEFYYDLNKDRDLLSANMKSKVQDMISGLEDDLQKIDTLYQYLKDHMRYVSVQLGIGGWQTFDAAYVEHNKFGDCKALSNFMGGMLKEAGIENNKVIIYRGRSGYRELSEDFVNTPFNHAMIYVPSEDMFLECTSNNYPAGYLGLDNADHKVLVSTEDGPIFMRTPHMGSEENTTETISHVKILEDGGAVIENSSIYRGGSHDYLRNMKDRVTEKEIIDGFQENFPLNINNLNYYNVNIRPNEPVLEIGYKVSVGNYASKAGKRIFIPINPIYRSTGVPSSVKDRKMPFSQNLEEMIENQITIIIPDGYEIESMPNENYDVESDYGDFRLSIAREGNVIKVYKKWVSKKFNKPAEVYDSYRSQMRDFAMLDGGKIVLVKKKT